MFACLKCRINLRKVGTDTQVSDEQLRLLREIQAEWNKAEADVKTAEQVVSSIVIPAIKELRYGGRRLIDALACLDDASASVTFENLLRDARFDCHRARHDAIDAATAKIAIDLQIMTEKLGHDAVLGAYPAFSELYADLITVRDSIAQSRGQRENREAIYSSIEAVSFPDLVRSFNRMRTCEPMMIALARKGRLNTFLGKSGLYVGTGGLILAAFGIWLVYFPPQTNSSVPIKPSASVTLHPQSAIPKAPSR